MAVVVFMEQEKVTHIHHLTVEVVEDSILDLLVVQVTSRMEEMVVSEVAEDQNGTITALVVVVVVIQVDVTEVMDMVAMQEQMVKAEVALII